jgi:hypothetical protein
MKKSTLSWAWLAAIVLCVVLSHIRGFEEMRISWCMLGCCLLYSVWLRLGDILERLRPDDAER